MHIHFKGKAPSDDQRLCEMNLKAGAKIMMMGSMERAIQDVNENPTDLPTVVNDFDEDTERKISIEHREEYLAKVANRVQKYQGGNSIVFLALKKCPNWPETSLKCHF